MRHDPDDLTGFAVHDEGLADGGRIAAEFMAPVSVSENDSFRCARRVIFLSKDAAKHGWDSQERKCAVSDDHRRDLFRLGHSRDADGVALVHADILERLALLPINKIVGRGHVQVGDLEAGGVMPDAHKFFGAGIGERFQ